MKKYILLSLVIYISLFSSKMYCQFGVTKEDSLSISRQLKTIYGFDYVVPSIVNVDSVEDIYNWQFGLINDPYGTLKNCLLFTASKAGDIAGFDSSYSIVGVYKGGQVIWRSDFIKPPYFSYGEIYATVDLNNDGKVDILTQWTGTDLYGEEYLWIYEWDGTSGTVINDYNEDGTLISTHGNASFDFADFEGDGIWEIVGYTATSNDPSTGLPDDFVPDVYSWDGSKYALSKTIKIDSMEMFLPRNKFSAEIGARVVKENQNIFQYIYSVKNNLSSSQYINEIDVDGSADTILDLTEPNGWKNILFGSEVSWTSGSDDFFSVFTFKYKIKPGSELDNYSYETPALPTIVETYLRGFNYDNPGADSKDDAKDFLDNSVIDTTIGAAIPPDPFIPLNFLDTLLHYTTRSLQLGWIKDSVTTDKYTNYFNTAKTKLQQKNITGVKSTLNQVLQAVNKDSTSNLTSEAYALLRYNTEYLLAHLPNSNPSSLGVKLENSSGNLLTGGTLQYYDGSWKDATNNGDGTFGINTTKSTLSLRMNYAYGSQTVSNVPAQNNTYTFQTKDVSVRLKNSLGNLTDTGTVQYYAGAWRDFGTTVNGVAAKELLLNTYSFRMTYAHASNDKQQNIGTNPTVIFQTVNANVKLENSRGSPFDVGTVQYYAGAWRNFGTTTNGVATKELLPNNYSFRMIYQFISNDKQQNIGIDNIVKFSTVLCTIRVNNSQNQPVNGADIKYYSGAWREIGQTVNGQITEELLPKNISFRMNFNSVQQDKTQDISANPLVEFNTGTQ